MSRHSLKKLSDQVIVITGATSGIGLATARLAARKGARLVLVGRSEEDLVSLAQELREKGSTCVHAVADVSRFNEVEAVAERATREFGFFDTWINNAAVSLYGKLLETPIEEERRLFDVNYWGYVYGCRVAGRRLAQSGGAIVNIGSIVSERAIPLQGQYSASKHAIKAYTDALRMELGKDGSPVSVTLIKPASIQTPFTEHARNHLGAKAKLPPPLYDPQVVARAILYCAEHPRREIVVGGAGLGFVLLQRLMPGLGDRLLQGMLFRQQKEEGTPPADEAENLFVQHAREGEEHGLSPGRIRRRSLYTDLALRPTAAVAIAGAGALGTLLLMQRRRARDAA
jgi:short-subunit dehydrogenase